MIDGPAIKELERIVQQEKIEASGRDFVPQGYVPAEREKVHRASTLVLHSLTGLDGFLHSKVDDLGGDHDAAPGRLLIHVESPTSVRVLGPLAGWDRGRETFAVAEYDGPSAARETEFAFGRFLDLETFNVALQTLFQPADGDEENDRAAVLKLVGNITEENLRTEADDGVTQTISARAGITRVEDAEVPNPVMLRPYRTFREVEQPLSPFILRLRSSGGKGVTAALFEADGGGWRVEAVKYVVDWLKAVYGGGDVIG